MATKEVTKTVEVIVCDVDGCKNEDATPLPFNLVGQAFDLCGTHRAQIAGRGRQTAAPVRKRTGSGAENASEVVAIRQWAASKGKRWATEYGYKSNGRISNAVREAAKAEGII